MNKIWLFGAAISMVLAFGSCKPKQSAYKAAYEQAKEKESTAPVEVVEQEEEIVEEVAPVSKPRTSTATTRSEKINAAQGSAIHQTILGIPGSIDHSRGGDGGAYPVSSDSDRSGGRPDCGKGSR